MRQADIRVRAPSGGLLLRGDALARIGSAIRNAWAFLGITLLVLLAVELLLDAVVPDVDDDGTDPAPRYTADAYEGEDWARAYYREKRDVWFRWQPFVQWRRGPFAGEFIHIDERGLRRTWHPELAPGAPRVFVFGGSTLWGYGARDDHTIPSELSRLLHERGLAAEVVNFGESGWVSSQELVMLVREIQAGRVPDVVVFYDGVNDVVSAYQSGEAGLPQNESRRHEEFYLSQDRARLVSQLFRQTFEGVDKLQRWLTSERWQPPSDLPGLARDVVTSYVGAMRLASKLANEYDFALRYYWQPTVYTKASLTEYELGVRERWPDRHAFFDRIESELDRSSALRDDPRFRNLSRAFDPVAAPAYIDFCHLGEAGNAHVAAAIVDDVAADLRSRDPGVH